MGGGKVAGNPSANIKAEIQHVDATASDAVGKLRSILDEAHLPVDGAETEAALRAAGQVPLYRRCVTEALDGAATRAIRSCGRAGGETLDLSSLGELRLAMAEINRHLDTLMHLDMARPDAVAVDRTLRRVAAALTEQASSAATPAEGQELWETYGVFGKKMTAFEEKFLPQAPRPTRKPTRR